MFLKVSNLYDQNNKKWSVNEQKISIVEFFNVSLIKKIILTNN
jgi:hypothetical protein